MKLSIFPRKDFFTPAEKQQITDAIQQAERRTSGEIRVYVESRCRFVDPLDRAAEVFWLLKMDRTAARNGVLVYLAMKDRQLAIFGDQGIHEKVGQDYWNTQVAAIIQHMRRETYGEAICRIITDIGEALRNHFPYDGDTDRDELPNDIVQGR